MRARLLQGFAATLFVHACTSLCALSAALPLARAVPALKETESHIVELLLVAVRLFYAATGAPAEYGALPLLMMLAMSPLLRSVWLRALWREGSLHEHGRAAISGYKSALWVTLICGGYLLASAGSACLLGGATWLALTFTNDIGLQASAAMLVALPCVFACLVHAPSLSDAAQLQLAAGETQPQQAVRTALAMIDRRVLGMRGALWIAQACLTCIALSTRVWFGSSAGATTTNLVFGQLLMLAHTLLRALWLVWLTTRARASNAMTGRTVPP